MSVIVRLFSIAIVIVIFAAACATDEGSGTSQGGGAAKPSEPNKPVTYKLSLRPNDPSTVVSVTMTAPPGWRVETKPPLNLPRFYAPSSINFTAGLVIAPCHEPAVTACIERVLRHQFGKLHPDLRTENLSDDRVWAERTDEEGRVQARMIVPIVEQKLLVMCVMPAGTPDLTLPFRAMCDGMKVDRPPSTQPAATQPAATQPAATQPAATRPATQPIKKK
jgi:hypothetical protein